MNNLRLYLLLGLLLIFMGSYAECQQTRPKVRTQKGVVKTKGRMTPSGKIVPGVPLEGVSVQVQGRNAMLTKSDGSFAFPFTGPFSLQRVTKAGYVLSDQDQLNRIYGYSESVLYVVMENEAQQRADLNAITIRIKNSLYAQLQRKSDEIEALKEQNKITQSRYDELLQKLDEDKESNESIAKEMAEAYVRMDFDNVDEFYRQVSSYILNGELLKADSMLNTKGDVSRDINHHIETGKALDEEKKRLMLALEQYKQNSEELANRCFSKYQISKMMHQNDSAAYYLDQRVRLDSTNVEWLTDAGRFQADYMADGEHAMQYFKRALAVASDSTDYRTAYNSIGALYCDMGHYAEALENLRKAVAYYSPYDLEHDKTVPNIYCNLSTACRKTNDWSEATRYTDEALRLSRQLFGEEHEMTAECYVTQGRLYDDIAKQHDSSPETQKKEHEQALAAHLTATNIFERLEGNYDFNMATCYNNVAGVYKELKQYPQAEEYYMKAMQLRKKILGEKNPRVGTIYNNLGVFYMDTGNPDKALDCYHQAVRLWATSKLTYSNLIPGYGNLGVIYDRIGNHEKSLEMFEKAEAVVEELYKPGEGDAMLFLQYIQGELRKLAPTSEKWQQRYEHFMDDKVAAAVVPKGANVPSSQRGLEGLYYILAIDDWNIDSKADFFDKVEEMDGKPKTVVFLQDGNIREEHFEGAVGCGWRIYRVTPEEKQQVRDSFEKWKSKK